MIDPRSTSPGSNMPSYKWLVEGRLDERLAGKRLAVMQKLGVPYTNEEIDGAARAQREQAATIVADLATNGVELAPDSEMAAMIAYLQRLGRDHGVAPTAAPAVADAAAAGGGR
jgi:cytochrome c oxidase cbb3-type subunit I/II